jgi:Sec-independent protein translocase protein TatA
MNIFGIGGAELVMIILIMLVVAGPKRMIRWAYIMGQYAGKLRKMWEEVVDVMQHEVDAAGLDIEIPKELPTRQNITKVVTKAVKPYTDSVQKELEVAQKPLQETVDEANQVLKETQKEASDAAAAKPISTKQTPTTLKEPEKKPDTNAGEFGAWSNPQHPSQQAEQEAN